MEARTSSPGGVQRDCLSSQQSASLNLATDNKGNKKRFYRYNHDKRKTRENVGLSRKKWETWLFRIWIRLRYSKTFFASVSTGEYSGVMTHQQGR